MSGTSEGGQKASQTIKDLYGKNFFKNIGAIGGSRKVKKGFAVSGLAIEAGRRGGTISKRRPSVK